MNTQHLLNDLNYTRAQAARMLVFAREDKLTSFSLHLEKLDTIADFVIDVILSRYPHLKIPMHSRMRHFEMVLGKDFEKFIKDSSQFPKEELGKILCELIILSVLVDAGAGSVWQYKIPQRGIRVGRSEGLAAASFGLYSSGLLSMDASNPWRVDLPALEKLSRMDFYTLFQHSPQNALVGIEQRYNLIKNLKRVFRKPFFDGSQRLGDLYDYLSKLKLNTILSCQTLFQTVLETFAPVWPKKDIGMHPLLKTGTLESEYIPFHKLSLWLTYSLIEPLALGGIDCIGIDYLTGLPEYRNGGLFIDGGLLKIKDPSLLTTAHAPDALCIVEWRALTIVLLDLLAEKIRLKLNKNLGELSLPAILQGGTWEAGRILALEKREGASPIQFISDGTVF